MAKQVMEGIYNMRIQDMLNKVNNHCDELEFADARRLIEYNMEQLRNKSMYNKLNENAKVLFKHITEMQNSGNKTLSRLEMHKINEINKYCSEFDVSMLKRTLKNSLDLLYRDDVQSMLTDNTKYILSSMGVILTGVRKEDIIQGN